MLAFACMLRGASMRVFLAPQEAPVMFWQKTLLWHAELRRLFPKASLLRQPEKTLTRASMSNSGPGASSTLAGCGRRACLTTYTESLSSPEERGMCLLWLEMSLLATILYGRG